MQSANSELEAVRKLAVIGAGRMGEILIASLLRSQLLAPRSIVATARRDHRLRDLAQQHGVHTSTDNVEAIAGADVVLLAVKPQVAPAVLQELAPALGPGQVLVSVIAGLSTESIEACLTSEVAVVRAMPNTPSKVGSGMTALCGGSAASSADLEKARRMFACAGRCMILDEKYFDAVTGLSGSGPAFIYIIIEAMAEGGVKMGLPRQVATELAAQTCLGSGHMVLETGAHPAQLKDEVTTPGGCTIDGILKLEEGGLRVTLIKALVESVRRAGGLVSA